MGLSVAAVVLDGQPGPTQPSPPQSVDDVPTVLPAAEEQVPDSEHTQQSRSEKHPDQPIPHHSPPFSIRATVLRKKLSNGLRPEELRGGLVYARGA